MMSKLKSILGLMRLPFLILTPACVFLGLGTALWRTGSVNSLHFILALVGGLGTHISVNAFNEYFDFRSGLDMRTRRTPFSGGSGTLPISPELAPQALTLALVAFAITAGVGIYFLSVWGMALLPLGVLGLLVIVTYTPLLAYNPLLCLIAPGLGFGTFMVMGTDFVLTGTYSWTGFIASLVPFFLVSDLLLLNQFPDVEADHSIGRRHYPIVIGRRKSSVIYGAFLAAAYVSIIIGVFLNLLPAFSLLGLIALFLAVPTAIGVYRQAEDTEALMPYLGYNVILNILTPTLVALGLLIG